MSYNILSLGFFLLNRQLHSGSKELIPDTALTDYVTDPDAIRRMRNTSTGKTDNNGGCGNDSSTNIRVMALNRQLVSVYQSSAS